MPDLLIGLAAVHGLLIFLLLPAYVRFTRRHIVWWFRRPAALYW